MDAKSYSLGKTIVKTAEVPAVVIIGSRILPSVLSHIGIDMDEETAVIVVSSIFGVVRGVSNWFKNRKNGKR